MTSNNVIIHKYEIVEKIGAGGFSTVYKAKHKITGKIVALKIVKLREYSKTILNESKILSFLNTEIGARATEFFPTLHWYGMFGNMTCLATTFYTGTFSDALRGLSTTLQRLDVCCQMLELMHHIHHLNVIHCDVKPDNFLTNDSGKLVLIDFGMARMCVDPDTGEHIPNRVSNTFFGTPKYASLNLHLGNRPSRRDDLITVGYLMLMVFGFELPWLENNFDDSKEIHDIRHVGNLHKCQMKQLEYLITYLKPLSVNCNNYLIPYFKGVYALKYEDSPDYSFYNSIFNTLY
jgi:casein kinase I family protein HRR25